MPGDDSADFSIIREAMVANQLKVRGITDARVLDAMARVPRHEFIAESYRGQAYADHPIPIGEGQTVSQPYIVALMLQTLAVESGQRILEIGTGSGYQTALLAELARHVYSMERHVSLAAEAEATLSRLGYANVTIVVGDGTQGLLAEAPFDAIVVSAAGPKIPPALFGQLAENGRMIIPVGSSDSQELQLVRNQDGRPWITVLEGCRFVPLVGGY